MRVYSLAAVRRPSAVAPPALAAPPAPLSAAFGHTTVLPNPASLAGDDASAARYTPNGRGLRDERVVVVALPRCCGATALLSWSFKMKWSFKMIFKDRLK